MVVQLEKDVMQMYLIAENKEKAKGKVIWRLNSKKPITSHK